jgi:AcrR family transcriptional regulator
VTGPRSRKGEDTRSRLIEAAKLVFEDVGFLDARISDISRRAGLSHGSFYHYFESKEAVFLEVAERQEDRFAQNSLLVAGTDGLSQEVVVTQLAAGLRTFLEEYRDAARIMAVIEQVSRSHEPVRGVRFERYREHLDQAERAIAQLQRRGWVDPALDPGIVAAALVATVTRFAELWFVQKTLDCPFDVGVEELTRICLNAMRLRDPGDVAGNGSTPG